MPGNVRLLRLAGKRLDAVGGGRFSVELVSNVRDVRVGGGE
jgi:hypothetical protein